MRITITSVFVDNQDKALKFYTEILGFVKQNDIPVGEFRWLPSVIIAIFDDTCGNLIQIVQKSA